MAPAARARPGPAGPGGRRPGPGAGRLARHGPGRPGHGCRAGQGPAHRGAGAWRGEPYADLPDEVARAERARLHETRTTAIELREAIRLHLGDAVEASRRLEPLVLEEPYRERLHLLQAVALVQAGRQVEAMALLRQLRTTLREDLGIDPGPAVAALETAVLQGRLEGGRPRPSTDVRVVLVDDHPVFRMGMSGLLSSLEGLEVAAVVGDADAARAAVDESVDVVLMDLDLGGDSGIDLTAELTAQYPDLQVLVMTMHDEDSFVRAALAAGAAGYLVKSAEPDDVHRAIRAVAAGELVVGAQVARAARSHLGGAHRGRP
ncbi:Response regulator containing a CheY-like receiver domain and an HTH DNA-binding domain [Nocardioides sp. J9]|uniref:BTAD domain-containing putative transcriptional regulator n=1 Tax=Nocardioides sp. J9 TaxID=935844 RepID=UPI0011A29CEE|nr:BTAD domain-containing putative transcriptional regulator [Nocardioides sp. J9]TWH00555.1 Response regulator containing a CheY-like receiver domain and an HTH DNA-binding domain [Nocardioides sp. J9]